MNTTKITIEYDLEKYKALSKFGAKKNLNIEDELKNTLEKLYDKTVPAAVKEYISED